MGKYINQKHFSWSYSEDYFSAETWPAAMAQNEKKLHVKVAWSMEILIYWWHFLSQLIKCALNLDINMFRHFNKKHKKTKYSLHNLLSNLKDHHKLQTSFYFSINPLSYD